MVREIRNDEFEGTYKEDNDRHRAVHKGDMVIMTSRYAVPNEIRGRIFKVMEEPRYKKGRKVCQLEGYPKGDYPVDGLRVVG